MSNKVGKRLITIDNGNTHCKVGIFKIQSDKNELIDVISYSKYQQECDDYLMISSVGPPIPEMAKADFKIPKRTDHGAFYDMPVSYGASLGEDRLVCSYFVFKTQNFKSFPKILLIDAGSFITCDLISLNGHEGGFIFPGLDRFLSTYSQSQNLPSLNTQDYLQFQFNINKCKETFLPINTTHAILSALDIYLEAVILKLITHYNISKIILTGGSGKLIESKISAKSPVVMDPHLIHSALSLAHRLHLFPKGP